MLSVFLLLGQRILLLVAEERERIEEELRDALDLARISYRLSMTTNGSAGFQEEACRNFREALERFHRFVLNGVIPEDLRHGMV